MCPLQWGKQAPSPAPGPLPHPLTLTHTPPVMFAGLSKESINSDLVAVRCGPLCGVVTFSEWESEFSPPPPLPAPPPPSFLLLAPRSGYEEGTQVGV